MPAIVLIDDHRHPAAEPKHGPINWTDSLNIDFELQPRIPSSRRRSPSGFQLPRLQRFSDNLFQSQLSETIHKNVEPDTRLFQGPSAVHPLVRPRASRLPVLGRPGRRRPRHAGHRPPAAEALRLREGKADSHDISHPRRTEAKVERI